MFFNPMMFDPIYWVVAIAALALSGGAALYVKSAFARYDRVPAGSGLTGAEAAQEMLASAGLGRDVSIERVNGFLSDHYDPKAKVLRLSPGVYDGRSVSAVAVACHEAGHAVQHAQHYAPLALRSAIVPTAAIAPNIGLALIFIGFLINASGLAALGLLLFSLTLVFQVVNLPVEFNASARAKAMLPQLGIVRGAEQTAGVNTVLNAAALTYVAGAVSTLMYVLYYAYLIFGRRN